MLAGLWPQDICVCYHLSSSINDNKRLRYRGLHITLILRITWLVIIYKSDPQIIMILKLLHSCQSPSSATHFSQFSPILSERFRDNLSEWHHICHQAASLCYVSSLTTLWLVTCHNPRLWLADAGHMSLVPAHLVSQCLLDPLYLPQTSVLVTPRYSGWHQNPGNLNISKISHNLPLLRVFEHVKYVSPKLCLLYSHQITNLKGGL